MFLSDYTNVYIASTYLRYVYILSRNSIVIYITSLAGSR